MLDQRMRYFVVVLSTIISISSNVATAVEPDSEEIDREALEERVEELLGKNNVDLRKDIDDIFRLADIYAEEGDNQEARRLYERALRGNTWRLKYQLKLARLMDEDGDKTVSIEKARIVYDYAEDEELIGEAQEFLSGLGVKVPEETQKKKQELAAGIEIVLVPVGKINRRLLDEITGALEVKMGLKYSVSDTVIELGKIDRSYADKYLGRVLERIRTQFTKAQVAEILSGAKLKEDDLEGRDGKVKFIEAFFTKIKLPKKRIEAFHQNLKEMENEGQYEAFRLIDGLKEKCFLRELLPTKRYIGITEADIFASDCNFLFGQASRDYALMSYHRFTAAFNDAPPNRPTLRKRTIKRHCRREVGIFLK